MTNDDDQPTLDVTLQDSPRPVDYRQFQQWVFLDYRLWFDSVDREYFRFDCNSSREPKMDRFRWFLWFNVLQQPSNSANESNQRNGSIDYVRDWDISVLQIDCSTRLLEWNIEEVPIVWFLEERKSMARALSQTSVPTREVTVTQFFNDEIRC